MPEDELHHPLHLRLLGAPVAADRLLDVRGRVLSGRDAGAGARDEDGAARLPDRERDAGVGADVRLLQRHRIRRVLGDEAGDPVEDRLRAASPGAARRASPAPVGSGPEAPVVFVDDAVPASSRSWIDAEDFHGETLGDRARTTPAVTNGRCA